MTGTEVSSEIKIGLLVLIGLPGSGKTTLSRNLRENKKINFIHVCYDELVPFGSSMIGWADNQWRKTKDSVLVLTQQLIGSLLSEDFNSCPIQFKDQIKNNLNNHFFVIIIDDNMYYKSMRYSLYQIARNNNIGYSQLFIKCPLETCLAINSRRPHSEQVPPYVIENMFVKIEAPNFENKWERFTLILNAHSENLVEPVLFLVNECLINFEYPKVVINESEKDALACSTSVLHQADISLRQIISTKIKEFIQTNGKVGLKQLSDELMERKLGYLNDLKNGKISLPDYVLVELMDVNVVDKQELKSFLEEHFRLC